MEEGGFLYSSDSSADVLPYWVAGPSSPKGSDDKRRHLIIPYTLDANDSGFASFQGFTAGDQFFNYLKDGFDLLYEEGRQGAPKMMSVGLHCRLVGRPGRAAALAKFLDYAQSREGVGITRRIDIAGHWRERAPGPWALPKTSAPASGGCGLGESLPCLTWRRKRA